MEPDYFQTIIPIESMSVEQAKGYSRLYFTFQQTFPELSPEQIALAISIVTGVCHYCWEEPNTCQCWNDD